MVARFNGFRVPNVLIQTISYSAVNTAHQPHSELRKFALRFAVFISIRAEWRQIFNFLDDAGLMRRRSHVQHVTSTRRTWEITCAQNQKKMSHVAIYCVVALGLVVV